MTALSLELAKTIAMAVREKRRRASAAMQATLNEAKLLAQQGNPWPYVDLQWPGLQLDDFQRDMISSVCDPAIREVMVKGNTGCGKSASAAIAIVLWYRIWDDSKTVLTSVSHEHAKDVLFSEVQRWFKRCRFRDGSDVQTEKIASSEEHFIKVVNPSNDEGFSGRHAPHTLFAFDEGSGVPDSRFKMAKTQATKFLVLSNPRTVSGAFRRAFPADHDEANKTQTIATELGRRRLITIDGADCLNVIRKCLEAPVGPRGGIEINGRRYEPGETITPEDYAASKPIIPGQVCYDTFLALCSDADPRWVGCFAHGQFPREDIDRQIILGSWLNGDHRNSPVQRWDRWSYMYQRTPQGARKRWLEALLPVTAFGLDVAASLHGDETVLAAGGPLGVRALHPVRIASTMDLCGWVCRTALLTYGIDLTRGGHPIAVDMDGLGKGVGDRLIEMGCQVIPIRGNETAREPKTFANSRAEHWGELGIRLNPDGPFAGQPFAMPSDSMLLQDLTAPERIYIGSDGLRWSVTPKDRPHGSHFQGESLKEKLGRSPDRGDAVVYLYQAIATRGPDLDQWLNVI